MGQEIAVNTSILGTDIEKMQNQLNIVKNDMDKMYQAVRILDSMWDGPANMAFNQQFNRDHNDMKTLCDTIQKIINCYSNAKKEYDSCEAEVGGIISSISV